MDTKATLLSFLSTIFCIYYYVYPINGIGLVIFLMFMYVMCCGLYMFCLMCASVTFFDILIGAVYLQVWRFCVSMYLVYLLNAVYFYFLGIVCFVGVSELFIWIVLPEVQSLFNAVFCIFIFVVDAIFKPWMDAL